MRFCTDPPPELAPDTHTPSAHPRSAECGLAACLPPPGVGVAHAATEDARRRDAGAASGEPSLWWGRWGPYMVWAMSVCVCVRYPILELLAFCEMWKSQAM